MSPAPKKKQKKTPSKGKPKGSLTVNHAKASAAQYSPDPKVRKRAKKVLKATTRMLKQSSKGKARYPGGALKNRGK